MAFVQARRNAGTGTTASVAMLANATAGNYLIAWIYGMVSSTVPTLPGGWTSIGTTSSGGGTARAGLCCAKFAAGGETGVSGTVPSGAWEVIIHEYSGIDSTNTVLGQSTSAARPTTGTATTTGGVANAVAVVFMSVLTVQGDYTTPTIGGVAATFRTNATLANNVGSTSNGASWDLAITNTATSYSGSVATAGSGQGSSSIVVLRETGAPPAATSRPPVSAYRRVQHLIVR